AASRRISRGPPVEGGPLNDLANFENCAPFPPRDAASARNPTKPIERGYRPMPAPINHSVETMLVRPMSALAEEADRAAERRRAFRYDNPEDKPLDTPTMPPVLRKHSLNLVDLYRSIDDGYNDRDLFCDAYQAITAANDALQALRGSQQLRRAA